MITCQINGVRAIPDLSNSLKITFENPYVKDSGSYTYEISFPMCITENRSIFGNKQRFDVTKLHSSFDDCKIFAGNRLIISGKGTVKSITNTTVKIQIVGGVSRIKYDAKWENHFIDWIDYGEAIIRQGLDLTRLDKTSYPLSETPSNKSWGPYVFVDLSSSNIIGDEGVFSLSPIYDETNGYIMNNLFKNGNTSIKNTPTILYAMAPQPYLIYILNKVMEYEGFKIERNDLDVEPWNRLVIANARRTTKLNNSLPHWSVYTFIEEVRKLFNVSFIFNEEKKTVSIIATNELTNNQLITYEVEDEFTSEYDEDGLENIITSNIEYEFANSENREWCEVIPKSIRDRFETIDCSSETDMANKAFSMTKKQRQTSIFHLVSVNEDWIWYDTEDGKEAKRKVGFFSPIIRDLKSDDFISLKICPVPFYKRKKVEATDTTPEFFFTNDQFKDAEIFIPSTESEIDTSVITPDEEDGGFISIKDALEGVKLESEEEDDNKVLQVMFVGKNVRHMKSGHTYPVGHILPEYDGEGNWWWPITLTDWTMLATWSVGVRGDEDNASLSLTCLPHRGENLPELIDKHNQLTIKFITDDIPDPSKIYLFHGKRYICEKVEMSVTATGVDKVKTGYFYEYL